jgi:two-component system response regulator YesN
VLEPQLKLLIADDEAEIRAGISQIIPWEANGVAVAGMAGNGKEALELIRSIRPDIVLLDIRMPLLNGLEVLERIAGEPGGPKVIILSGYDDFQYCRRALRTGVIDYLLKPCRPEEVLNAVLKAKAKINNEAGRETQGENGLRPGGENPELLREKLAVYLIRHAAIDYETSHSRWRSYEMAIPPQNIGVALIRIDLRENGAAGDGVDNCADPAGASPEGPLLETVEQIRTQIRRAILNFLKQTPALSHFIAEYNDDLLIFWNLEAEAVTGFAQRMERLLQSLELVLPRRIIIGLGEPALDLAGIHSAFNSALLAVEHGFWEGPGSVVRYSDVAEGNAVDPNLVYREQMAVVQCVRTNDSRQLFPAMEAFFAQLMRQGSKAYVQKMVLALMCSVYHVCVERGIGTERIFGPNLSVLDELPHLKTPDELQQRIYQCVSRIVEEHPAHANQCNVVNNALQYMEAHYAEALSLEKVAREVYVSAGYLSALFKKVARKNFVDCLHETRVAKARELLRDGRLKVYEVALRVGYKDEKYFSQIFKKVTGMTPNQYRETTRVDLF